MIVGVGVFFGKTNLGGLGVVRNWPTNAHGIGIVARWCEQQEVRRRQRRREVKYKINEQVDRYWFHFRRAGIRRDQWSGRGRREGWECFGILGFGFGFWIEDQRDLKVNVNCRCGICK